jgi:hypothetical protein
MDHDRLTAAFARLDVLLALVWLVVAAVLAVELT